MTDESWDGGALAPEQAIPQKGSSFSKFHTFVVELCHCLEYGCGGYFL